MSFRSTSLYEHLLQCKTYLTKYKGKWSFCHFVLCLSCSSSTFNIYVHIEVLICIVISFTVAVTGHVARMGVKYVQDVSSKTW